MNKVVRKEHYPVDRLPDDLKADLPAGSLVKVTVEIEEERPERPMTLEEIFSAVPPEARSTPEEIDAFIRAERDAWDDERG